MMLETDDGALIRMSYRGVQHASAEVGARLERGERFFETVNKRYAWSNHVIAVGMGDRRRDGVVYDVFEVS